MKRLKIVLTGAAGFAVGATALTLSHVPTFVDAANAQSGGPAGCYGGGSDCDRKPNVRPIAAPASSGGFAGKWTGKADGGKGFATITATPVPNRYKMTGDVVNPGGCSGSVEGMGIARGDILTLIIPVPDSGGQCEVTYTKSGSTLRVHEGDNCSYFHGPSCAFDGSLTKPNAVGHSTVRKRR